MIIENRIIKISNLIAILVIYASIAAMFAASYFERSDLIHLALGLEVIAVIIFVSTLSMKFYWLETDVIDRIFRSLSFCLTFHTFLFFEYAVVFENKLTPALPFIFFSIIGTGILFRLIFFEMPKLSLKVKNDHGGQYLPDR